MKKRIADLVAWAMALRPVRVWNHFGERNGQVLAAGMSYQALFAVFAGVYVGFSIAGIWLIGQRETFESLLAVVNTTIPGLIGDDGVIQPSDVAAASAASAGFLTWTGIIALIGLIMTATGWISFARLSVRVVFGLKKETRNFAILLALDLLVALALGVLLIVAAVLSVVSTAALDSVFGLFGVSTAGLGYTLLARGLGLLIVLVINTATLVLMFRFLSRATVGWRALLGGSVLGGVGLLVLQLGSSLLVGGAASNPLLASFAVLIGLLLFFRLTNMVILVAASWIAVGAADREKSTVPDSDELEGSGESLERDERFAAACARVVDARHAHAHSSPVRRLAASRRLRSAERELADLVVANPDTLSGVR